MRNARLSIITVVKDDAAGLAQTIESVRAQREASFEYLVVDGASVDSSIRVIQENAGIVDWWTSEKDSGIYSAMNKGIRQASGEYCLFLNSGDRLARADTASRIVASLSPEVDVLYSDAKLVGRGKARIDWSPRRITPGFFLIGTLNHQNTAIRRALLMEEGLYREDLRIASDWYFFLRASSTRRVEFRYFPTPMVEYDNEGLSSKPEGAALNERERAACVAELFCGFAPLVEELRGFEDSRYGSILRHFGYSGILDAILRVYRIIARAFSLRYLGIGR